MKVGVFHPALDMCGGAEFVAVVIANTLAQNGYEVELFVNKEIDQKKTEKILGERVSSSAKIVVKPTFLQPRGMFDIYPRAFRSLAFKSKCDILIDTYSCCVFPWTDICYFHFPYLNRYDYQPHFPYLKSAHLRQVVSLPYAFFEKNFEKYDAKLLLVNSYFTAEAVKEFLRVTPKVLYPPVPSTFFSKGSVGLNQKPRENLVVTVSRFGRGKGIETIPYIAKLTNKDIHFVMIGVLHDTNVLQSVLNSIKKLGLTDRVKVLTNVSRQEMKMILNSAKIYLHTKVREAFGISIVEAMAMGCLPVVHNSGGVKEYLPEDFRYENPRDAARRIDKAIYEWSSGRAKEMMRIAERYSEENFSRKFIKIFKQYEKKRVTPQRYETAA